MLYALDGRRMQDRAGMHDHLTARLRLPAYYGRNLDALHDVLSEREGGEIVLEHAADMPDGLKAGLLAVLSDLAPAFRLTVTDGVLPGRIRAVIFDMDGVMVDSEPRHIRACDGIVRRISGGAHGASEVHTVGISTVELYRRALAYCGAEGDPKTLAKEHFDTTLRLIREEIPQPDEALIPLLQALKADGVRIAVASSSPRDYVEAVLALYGLTDLFELVMTGSDVSTLKPDPGIYLTACERLGLSPAEAAALEDSHIGTMAATGAGLYTIGYYNPGCGRQDLSLADAIVDGFADVRTLLKREGLIGA